MRERVRISNDEKKLPKPRAVFDEKAFKGAVSIELWRSQACTEALMNGDVQGKPYVTKRFTQEVNLLQELKLHFSSAALKGIVKGFRSGRLKLGVGLQAMYDCWDTGSFERAASFGDARKGTVLVKRAEVVFAEAAKCRLR